MGNIPSKNRRWTKEVIANEISKLDDCSAKQVQRSRPELYGAAVRHFGSWKKAVESSGRDYFSARKKRPLGYWTESSVIEGIKASNERHSAYVRKQHADLYNAALRIFGSWRAAIEAAGFRYNEIQKGILQKKKSDE